MQERPEILEGKTVMIPTGFGKAYITITELNGEPFEVFINIGKSGKSTTAKAEAIGRLVSLNLRSGVDVQLVIKQLVGITGEQPFAIGDTVVLSIPDAVGKVLAKLYPKPGKGV